MIFLTCERVPQWDMGGGDWDQPVAIDVVAVV
jgi:hypothetical protein